MSFTFKKLKKIQTNLDNKCKQLKSWKLKQTTSFILEFLKWELQLSLGHVFKGTDFITERGERCNNFSAKVVKKVVKLKGKLEWEFDEGAVFM